VSRPATTKEEITLVDPLACVDRNETTFHEVVERIREGTFYDDYDWASGPALRALARALLVIGDNQQTLNVELIEETIEFIRRSNERDADRHYSRIIFKRRHEHDTPEEKYLDDYNSEAKDLINRLNTMIEKFESN